MKFTLKVAYLDGSGAPWTEPYNRPEIGSEEAAKSWAERTIKNFNDTLRPGEKARKFLGVFFDQEDNKEKAVHLWSKTNLVTIIRGHRSHDTLKCLNCGVTAKRFGLDSIKIDSQFRAKKYQSCPGKQVV